MTNQIHEEESSIWHNHHGEMPDQYHINILNLAHRAVKKFPELEKRYRRFIGTAAVVSTAVIVLASIAVARRLHRGQSPERILREITAEEIENVQKEKPKKPKSAKSKGGSFIH